MGLETIALIAGAALSAAGTGVGMYASSQERQAMEQRTKDEMARQMAFDNKARGSFEASLGKSGVDTTNEQIAKGTADRAAEYSKLDSVPLTASQTTPLDQAESTQEKGAQQGRRQNQERTRAATGGMAESTLQDYIKNQRAAQEIGLVGQARGASAGLLPYELQRASVSHQGEHALGTGLSALGAIAGMYGAIAPALSAGVGVASAAGPSAASVAAQGGEAAVAGFYHPPAAAASYNMNQWGSPTPPTKWSSIYGYPMNNM